MRRAICPLCGLTVTLDDDGRIRPHHAIGTLLCPETGNTPPAHRIIDDAESEAGDE